MSLDKAKELRADRLKIWEEAKALSDAAEGRALNSEEKESWDKMMVDIDAKLEEAQDLEERHDRSSLMQEELDRKQERLTAHPETRTQSAEQNEIRHKEAVDEFLRKPWDDVSPESKEVLRETRALASQVVGTDASGGYTVPTEMYTNIVSQMKAFGGMRRAAFILRTDNGRDMTVPTSDDTSNKAKIIGEATAASTSKVVPFGSVTLEAPKYTSGPIKLSSELQQDSAFDMIGFVSDKMAQRFMRGTEEHFITRSSTESAGPHGIINDCTGVVAVVGGATAITLANIHSLIHEVDPAYRPGSVFMFSDTVLQRLRALRAGTSGAYLFQPNPALGLPDTIDGYPYIVNQDVQSGTTGHKFAWYGNFAGHYWIREVNQMAIRRLVERYADEDVDALIGFMRIDGRAVFATTTVALKPYKCMIHTT